MGLLVCDECKCVDNTSCVSPDWENLNPDFPNMGGMEMHGFREKWDTEKIREEEIILCSECNTGTWHGEFEKQPAGEIEIEMAKHMEGNVFSSHYLYEYDHIKEGVTLEDVIEWNRSETESRKIVTDGGWAEQVSKDLPYDKMKWANKWGRPYIRLDPKIGRNDPCPCGSGKKYKKCCLRK